MPDKKILVVEDDFMNMKLTCHILESEGYEVLRATTARQAMEKMKTTPPDLILMDMQLPDINGATAVGMIRKNTAGRGAVILALTACAMKGDRERVMQTGCDGYISKPINVRDFINTLRKFLNKEKTQMGESPQETEGIEGNSKLVSDLLADISHELRTPLNVIIGFSELMLDEIPGKLNKRQKQCLNDILSSSQHLLHLIDGSFAPFRAELSTRRR
ncbi:MAG TPA: response regulator [Dehalococcoidia bacterium]|nr:response regulator [Dehalococcoidia bacterium]